MEFSWWLVHMAVFAAALLQAATGIGFGVIAGPILLLILNSASAIQVSIILSLIIALVLAPSVFRRIDKILFRLLVIGTIIGIPLGIVVFMNIDLFVLKVLAGVSVAFMALTTSGVFRPRNGDPTAYSGKVGVGIGALSGLMSSSLGMPGPVPAAWMITRFFSKEVIRATILLLFVPSYCAALAFQSVTPGLGEGVIKWSLQLLPATIVGILLGKVLESRISQSAFKTIVTIVLSCTAISLFVDVLNR